ncbi:MULTISPECIES: DUF3027 domain-containing protein [unclassified Cryobacterium]|uniref:DUF3027 domain-containing protein n=1 Tax=unclassified Cryobacterium TaxID=2649013 RepID=UPI001E41E275|nr:MULTISPECIES: DUF3027 domain-containing protein [unclassified Cryobacterium]
MPEAAADERLLSAVDQARTALLEITPADSIGEPLGHLVEGEHVLSLLFDCNLSGYPGWRWTVTLARVDKSSEPSVLEAELTPGDDALIAPEWVPWSDRLADYRTAQELAAAVADAEALGDDGESDDDDESDDDGDDGDDGDESDDDEDRGEDVLDGIDFGEALTAPEPYPGNPEQAEAEADEGSPEPPAHSGGGEFVPEDERERERH